MTTMNCDVLVDLIKKKKEPAINICHIPLLSKQVSFSSKNISNDILPSWLFEREGLAAEVELTYTVWTGLSIVKTPWEDLAPLWEFELACFRGLD